MVKGKNNKKKNKKKKTKVLWYICEGLKCQGKKELRFLKECVRYKKTLPIKADRIQTPDGYYTPDFEYYEEYIEIKSLGTFKVMLGLEAYKGIGEPSDLQFRKIKWVAKNIKPIAIIVYLGPRESKPNIHIKEENITVTFKGGYKKKKS